LSKKRSKEPSKKLSKKITKEPPNNLETKSANPLTTELRLNKSRKIGLWALAVLVFIIVSAVCYWQFSRFSTVFAKVTQSATAITRQTAAVAGAPTIAEPTAAEPTGTKLTFVGAGTCKQCHAAEYELWRGSHHDLAMQPATANTVLGDFNNARFTYNKITTTFFRRGAQFFVNTDGPDGALRDYQIRYTFGFKPLQQYLIEFPDGRMQALSIAWDTRSKAQGGQRWFHLYPGQAIDYRSPLHWSGRDQNWNYMCAECHSTRLRKNYDFASDSFHTTWSEINVACEACHGPGSEHIKQAHAGGVRAADGLTVHFPAPASWVMDVATGNAKRASPRTDNTELETCAVCHSRRAQIKEGYQPGQSLLDTHIPALLSEHLYEADGQMRDEVFNYGSFLQSKMFANGVSCGDCHEPHSLKLRAADNGVCLQCHAASKYDNKTHHRHDDAAATSCPACHMPQRTYMGVDKRHDHSFRIPRPDLSQQLGTPNACNDCHRDKSATWAAQAIETWFGAGRKGFQHYGAAFNAAHSQKLEAPELLRQIAIDTQQPTIARATAAAELANYLTPALVDSILPGLQSSDPLLRLGAVRGLANAPLEQRWSWLAPLLGDAVRAVRIEVAAQLAGMPETQMNEQQRRLFVRAIEDYIAAQQNNAERPESHVNLGLLYAERGAAEAAESEYRAALRLAPNDIRASVNLADLYRQLGRDADGERVLRAALAAAPNDATLHYSLAMLLVRSARMPDALTHLHSAVTLQPDQAQYTYLYAVALHDNGKIKPALQLLENNLRRHPADRDTLMALISYYREQGDTKKAAVYAQQLQRLAN
jgi:tetratricopeptide (TPR) repeat protein